MKVLGIDPGIAITGYGIVENNKCLTYGTIESCKTLDHQERLKILFNSMTELIKEYKPDQIAMEALLFNKNIKTAISISEASGVILLAASLANIKVYKYTPPQVKQGVAFYGRSSKKDVQFMVTKILGLKEIPKPDDAADGLAIAITHSNLSY